MLQPEQAGWFDTTGTFTAIGPPSSNPEFGGQIHVRTIGFDKHDSFYYVVNHYAAQNSNEDAWDEYFRVPAGSTGNGESVGRFTVKSGQQSTFGLLPDGTLGLGAPPIPSCYGAHGMEAWDPSFTFFFEMARDNRLYKTNGLCAADTNGGELGGDTPFSGGTPLTPPHWNVPVGGPVVNPDRSQVAVQDNRSPRVLLIDTNAPNTPRPVSLPADVSYSNGNILIEWR